uniref:Uncharacterized protein n=1 Tax=Palpitomonas bilix TaxID=652834 RepID=A0A7S3DLE0_9EUKA
MSSINRTVHFESDFMNALQPVGEMQCQGLAIVINKYSSQTGVICSSGFTHTDADILCREAGFEEGAESYFFDNRFKSNTSEKLSYVFGQPSCLGLEASIYDCPGMTKTHACHSTDSPVSVVCKPCSIHPSSPPSPVCENGGLPTGGGRCNCPSGFAGVRCEQRQCATACHNGGECTEIGTCSCQEGYFGRDCTEVRPNLVIDGPAKFVLNRDPRSPFLLSPAETHHTSEYICSGVPYKKKHDGNSAFPYILPVDTPLEGHHSADTENEAAHICSSLFDSHNISYLIEWELAEIPGFFNMIDVNDTISNTMDYYGCDFTLTDVCIVPLPHLFCGPCVDVHKLEVGDYIAQPMLHTNVSASACNYHGQKTSDSSCSCDSGWQGSDCSFPVMAVDCPTGSSPLFPPNLCRCYMGTVIRAGEDQCLDFTLPLRFSLPALAEVLHPANTEVTTFLLGVPEVYNPYTVEVAAVAKTLNTAALCLSMGLEPVDLLLSFDGELRSTQRELESYLKQARYNQKATDLFQTDFEYYSTPTTHSLQNVMCANFSADEGLIGEGRAICSGRGKVVIPTPPVTSSSGALVLSCACDTHFLGATCEYADDPTTVWQTNLANASNALVQTVVSPIPTKWDRRGGQLIWQSRPSSSSSVNVCSPSLLNYYFLGRVSYAYSPRWKESMQSSFMALSEANELFSDVYYSACADQGLDLLSVQLELADPALFSASTNVYDCSASSTSLAEDCVISHSTEVTLLASVQCSCGDNYVSTLPLPRSTCVGSSTNSSDICSDHGLCVLDEAKKTGVCECRKGWTGAYCDTCGERWKGYLCDTCAMGWTGPECDKCALGWTGAQCNTCALGWTGSRCDACALGWTGTRCDICAPGHSGSTCAQSAAVVAVITGSACAQDLRTTSSYLSFSQSSPLFSTRYMNTRVRKLEQVSYSSSSGSPRLRIEYDFERSDLTLYSIFDQARRYGLRVKMTARVYNTWGTLTETTTKWVNWRFSNGMGYPPSYSYYSYYYQYLSADSGVWGFHTNSYYNVDGNYYWGCLSNVRWSGYNSYGIENCESYDRYTCSTLYLGSSTTSHYRSVIYIAE